MSRGEDPLEPLFSFDIPEGDAGSARAGLAAGEVIAGWKIVRRIAGGALSSVYEAVRADEEDGGERKGEEGASKSATDFDGTGGALADKQPVAQETESTDSKRVSGTGGALADKQPVAQGTESTDSKRVSGTGGALADKQPVAQGTERGSERRVAIKVFDGERMDESAMRRFRLHATALGGLTHPGLVGVTDWGVDPAGRPYLVMALVEGVTFDAWLASDGGSDGAAIVEVMADAAEAVGRAHVEMGIVHRDLKPTNVMVDVDGEGRTRARVIDFGIAMVLRGSEARSESLVTRGGAVVGTPAFMAPEQMYAGARAVDARADVYALGVMIYEALTGSRPVRATDLSLVELAREKERVRVSARRIRRLARAEGFDVSGATASVIAAAISPDPEDRQADGLALALDLRRALRGAPARHRGPGAVRRFRRFLAREPRLGAALIALVATLTLSAGVIGALAIRAERARRAEHAQTERLVSMVKSWAEGGFQRAFQTPASEPALIAVTEAVIHALEEASAVRPEDIELAEQLSLAYSNLADVVGQPAARGLGDEARARELYDKSAAAASRAVELYREQRPSEVELASLSVASAYKRRVMATPDASERRDLLDRALEISTRAFERMPESDEVRMSHTSTLTLWADEHLRGEARIRAHERTMEVLAGLPTESPRRASADHQRMLLHLKAAESCVSEGLDGARRHLDAAVALLDARIGGRALDPLVPYEAMLLRILARVEMMEGQIAAAEGRWEEADTRSAACVERTRELIEADPLSPLSMLDHAVRLRERAEILLAAAEQEGVGVARRAALRAEAVGLLREGLERVRGIRPERARTRHEEEEIEAFERVMAGVKH